MKIIYYLLCTIHKLAKEFKVDFETINFYVFDEIPFTPHRNILEGISRNYIAELHNRCPTIGILPYDIYNADEAFITATPFCALPVTSLNGNKIGNGKPGKIYNQILNQWSKNVGVDIRTQIQKWDEENDGSKRGRSPYEFQRAVNSKC